MSFGRLNLKQRRIVAKAVKGRTVHDLGAGDLQLSGELVDLGAAKVIAIDKDAPHYWKGDSRIEVRKTYFHAVQDDPIEVAFVSWPSNYVDWDLIRLVRRSQRVIYLGNNMDGTSCGSVPLFEHLLTRELVEHVPDRPNTLLVYGAPQEAERDRVGEELAALTAYQRMWRYEELYPTSTKG